MDVTMMARMKALEEENLRLRKMIVDERLKAEIVEEAPAKKWCGHHDAARWPGERFKRKVSPSRWLAKPFR
jgi:hypothetical protein